MREMLNQSNDKRKDLLKRASNFKTVPGHGPSLEEMSNEKLEKYVTMLEKTFEEAFGEEE